MNKFFRNREKIQQRQTHHWCSKVYLGRKNIHWRIISHGLTFPDLRPQHFESSVGLEQMQPISKVELLNVLYETQRTIPEHYLNKLQARLPKRAQAVLKSKGRHTKYGLSSLLEVYWYYFHVSMFQ